MGKSKPVNATSDSQDNTANGRSPSLSPSDKYFIWGADLHFLLDRTLYRVHSHFFLRESNFWRNQLPVPSSPGDPPLTKGMSPSNAIILNEDPDDFECLLWVFYNPKYGDYSGRKVRDWIAILRYANIWDLPEVKKLAIRYLQGLDMDPVERIRLYQDNNVPEQYLFPLYRQLACRGEPLGLEESRTLGIETLVLIFQARERLRAQPSADHRMLSPIRTDLDQQYIDEVVSATFNISLVDEIPITGNTASPIRLPRAGRQATRVQDMPMATIPEAEEGLGEGEVAVGDQEWMNDSYDSEDDGSWDWQEVDSDAEPSVSEDFIFIPGGTRLDMSL